MLLGEQQSCPHSTKHRGEQSKSTEIGLHLRSRSQSVGSETVAGRRAREVPRIRKVNLQLALVGVLELGRAPGLNSCLKLLA